MSRGSLAEKEIATSAAILTGDLDGDTETATNVGGLVSISTTVPSAEAYTGTPLFLRTVETVRFLAPCFVLARYVRNPSALAGCSMVQKRLGICGHKTLQTYRNAAVMPTPFRRAKTCVWHDAVSGEFGRVRVLGLRT